MSQTSERIVIAVDEVKGGLGLSLGDGLGSYIPLTYSDNSSSTLREFRVSVDKLEEAIDRVKQKLQNV